MAPRTKIPLTLIVAATKSLGIGNAGGLPWPQLKQEMAYFARVTKRVPQGSSDHAQNALIMGRKTWESIPEKFRPLKGRLNLVVSRSHDQGGHMGDAAGGSAGPMYCTSLDDALQKLQEISDTGSLGRTFVIGGGSMYAEALKYDQTNSILFTRIAKDYDCDTRFPIDPESQESIATGWRQRNNHELGLFVGEDMSEPDMVEDDVEYTFCLFERTQ